MSSFAANRIRLALELTKANFPDDQLDAFTGATPRGPFGRLWDFELGLFNKGVLDPLTSIQSITIEVKAAANGIITPGGAALLSRTVASGTFNAALTADQWTNDQGTPSYHAKISFLDTETATLNVVGAVNNQLIYGWVATAQTAAGRITIGSGLISLIQDGGTGAGAGTAPMATYTFSDAELLARFNTKLNAGENDPGLGYVLRDIGGSGWGLRMFVEMEGGRPVLRQVEVPPLI